jgi:hypothetical protein
MKVLSASGSSVKETDVGLLGGPKGKISCGEKSHGGLVAFSNGVAILGLYGESIITLGFSPVLTCTSLPTPLVRRGEKTPGFI